MGLAAHENPGDQSRLIRLTEVRGVEIVQNTEILGSTLHFLSNAGFLMQGHDRSDFFAKNSMILKSGIQ